MSLPDDNLEDPAIILKYIDHTAWTPIVFAVSGFVFIGRISPETEKTLQIGAPGSIEVLMPCIISLLSTGNIHLARYLGEVTDDYISHISSLGILTIQKAEAYVASCWDTIYLKEYTYHTNQELYLDLYGGDDDEIDDDEMDEEDEDEFIDNTHEGEGEDEDDPPGDTEASFPW